MGPVPIQLASPLRGVGREDTSGEVFWVRARVVGLAGGDVWNCAPTPTLAGEIPKPYPILGRSSNRAASKPSGCRVPPTHSSISLTSLTPDPDGPVGRGGRRPISPWESKRSCCARRTPARPRGWGVWTGIWWRWSFLPTSKAGHGLPGELAAELSATGGLCQTHPEGGWGAPSSWAFEDGSGTSQVKQARLS